MTEINFSDMEDDRHLTITEWDHIYMQMAELMALNSKCASRSVGVIVVKNNSVVSSGVNGTPPGFTNCCDIFEKDSNGNWIDKESREILEGEDKLLHHVWSNRYEIHAEVNALSKMTMNGISSNGADLYITHSPCFNCAKTIIASGIDTIYYKEDYDNVNYVVEFLHDNGVRSVKLGDGYEE